MRGAVGLVLILLLTSTALGVDDACRWVPPDNIVVAPPAPAMEPAAPDTYTGTIRVFVAEITGRWEDDEGIPFHNAFLGFALEENIALNETDSLSWELVWDGYDYYDTSGQSFGDIQEDNIKVIVAVFNSAGYTGYSDPPGGGSFTVHEVDACAGAKCGAAGYNLVFGDFTHSVYDDDGVTTW
jgi:hypothetical protein